MTVRWIVFDAVGTLIEPDPDVATAYHLVGRRHGSELTRDQVSSRFRAAFRKDELRDQSAGRLTTSEEIEKIRWKRIVCEVFDDVRNPDRCFQELFDHFGRPDSWRCFEDAATALEQLRDRGFRLAVASNFDRRLHPICDELKPLSLLEQRIVSSEIGWRKPAAEFFAAVLAQLGVPAASALFVGDDAVNDVSSARAAGLRAIHVVRRPDDAATGASEPDAPVSLLTQLLERLAESSPDLDQT